MKTLIKTLLDNQSCGFAKKQTILNATHFPQKALSNFKMEQTLAAAANQD